MQTIILIGVILLTANTASTYYNWVIFYAFSQFIFGFGIGGEYPVRRGLPHAHAEARRWCKALSLGSMGRPALLFCEILGQGSVCDHMPDMFLWCACKPVRTRTVATLCLTLTLSLSPVLTANPDPYP